MLAAALYSIVTTNHKEAKVKHSLFTFCTVFFITLILMSKGAHAVYVTSAGNAVFMGNAPLDVSEGAIENSAVMVFHENIGMTLSQAMPVDYDLLDEQISLFGFPNSIAPLTGTLFSSRYDSHLIHYDPFVAGASSPASIRFDGTIVGVFASISGLNSSDAIFNATTTDYNSGDNPLGRAAESDTNFSFFASTLNIFNISTDEFNVSQLRVITTAEIDPTVMSSPSIGVGFIALVLFFRKLSRPSKVI
jgi:hypothetical protein